ncbi:hypothetical protein BpHYR1_053607 [Brachionus plicatilis]|uniref:Uncharacterized protein n=1 Tax=Brachionus plicatilis TaxID=10195 RepID=A0A3M7PIF4_BRAPC|nr:hypothetical protein BpHYR1_053607 [Brachionus plicatilis]
MNGMTLDFPSSPKILIVGLLKKSLMHEIDLVQKSNNFSVTKNQERGHSVKYHKEISRLQQRDNSTEMLAY